MALIDDILRMKNLQAEIDELKEGLSVLQAEYDKLRLFDIPNAMSEQDTTSLKGEWGRCTLTADLTVKVNNKGRLHEWLENNGSGDLIVPQVNAQTLKAWVKEQIKAGRELPAEILAISPFSRAVLYK